MPDRPGLEPYSDEWMNEHATDVPEQLWEVVRSIARAYWIEGRDVNGLARIVQSALRLKLNRRHVLTNGRVAIPYEMRYNGSGWSYCGRIVSDGDEPRSVTYEAIDIAEDLA